MLLEQQGFRDGVTIVMPVLDEEASLRHCIANARATLVEMEGRFGLQGEIIVADNGSTDRSAAVARDAGALVVFVREKGYGAALMAGFEAATGRYLVMGDADGSYDFCDAIPMVEQLLSGADLCLGNRFAGGIAPGAMPWKNRYIGNPLLTGLLNLFFQSGIHDAHCGLRAISRSAFRDLRLSGTGMEFASEMVIKAALKHFRIDEVPAKLAPDLRMRPPHLRPWRDGWRHLRYLLMLSPTWVFGFPALGAMVTSVLVFFTAMLHATALLPGAGPFGASWLIVTAALFTGGHNAAMLAIATHLYGVKQGFRTLRPVFRRFAGVFKLETMLVTGSVLVALSVVLMIVIAYRWSASGFSPLASLLPLVSTAVIGSTGLQTIFAGFFMAIIVGHNADFGREAGRSDSRRIPLPNRQVFPADARPA